jgi:hypothetical protein
MENGLLLSSSAMEPVPWASAMVPPDGLDRFSVNVSVFSTSWSSSVVTATA